MLKIQELKLSNKTIDHAIRLNWHANEVQELWFWHRWFQTDEWRERIARFGCIIREVSQQIEHVFNEQEKAEIVPFWNQCFKIYVKHGGK